MSRRWHLLCCLVICSVSNLLAQESAWAVEAGYGQGNFYTHPSLRAPLTNALRSVEINLFKKSDGSHYWQQLHGYPDMGLKMRLRDMGNSSVYGQVYTLIPFLQFYPVKRKNWRWFVAHGTGVSYVTRIYSVENPENRLISSHLNAASFLSTGVQWHFLPDWILRAGIDFSHESNGNLVKHNKGFNTWAFGGGLRAAFGRAQNILPKMLKETPLKRWLFSAEAACGFYNYDRKSGNIDTRLEITAAAFRQHNDRFRSYLGLGVFRENAAPDPYLTPFIIGGEEVLLGAMSIRYSLGFYLASDDRARLLEKVGIGWYPFRKRSERAARGFYTGMFLKAHGTTAAHIELMAGNVF